MTADTMVAQSAPVARILTDGERQELSVRYGLKHSVMGQFAIMASLNGDSPQLGFGYGEQDAGRRGVVWRPWAAADGPRHYWCQHTRQPLGLFGGERLRRMWAGTRGHPRRITYCATEVDALALMSAGHGWAVCFPSPSLVDTLAGMNAWALEADIVTIALGGGDWTRETEEALVARYGRDRCRVVPAWNDTGPLNYPATAACAVADGLHEEALARLDRAQVPPSPHVVTLDSPEMDKKLDDLYEGRTGKSYSTGFANLDNDGTGRPLFRIGPGGLHLFVGIPGSGKSELMSQIAINTAREHGFRWLFYSPEHHAEVNVRRLLEIQAGKPFNDGPNPRMSREQVQEARRALASHFRLLHPRSLQDLPSMSWLLGEFEAEMDRWGGQGNFAVVIDPFNTLKSSAAESRQSETQRIHEDILLLKQWAQRNGAAVMLVAHPAKMETMRGGRDAGKLPVPTLYSTAGSASFYNQCDAGVVIHRTYGGTGAQGERLPDHTEFHVHKMRENYQGCVGMAAFRYQGATRRFVPADLGGGSGGPPADDWRTRQAGG